MSVKKSHYPKLWTEKIFNCESNSINLMGTETNKPQSDSVYDTDSDKNVSIRTLPLHTLYVIMVVVFYAMFQK